MKEYLFYIEGLNREVWQKGASCSIAYQNLWQRLTESERGCVVQMDCVDERECA